MVSLRFVLVLLGATASLCAPSVKRQKIPGKYLVSVKPSLTDRALALHTRWASNIQATSLQRRGGDAAGVEKTFSFPGYKAYAGSFDEATVEALSASPDVLTIEPDQTWTLYSLTAQENPIWGLSVISHSNPLSNSSAYIYDSSAGDGTFAYVLDTGIYVEHPDFEGRAVLGYNPAGDTDLDTFGHGTHVAGTVGSLTYGVAKKTQLIGVKVFAGSSSSTSIILDGICWTANDIISKGRVGKAVVNMSFGGGIDSAMDTSIQAVIDNGITVVVAAGNENRNASDTSPSRLPDAITVAASDITYSKWIASNWGPSVDIFAPGEKILSLGNNAVNLTLRDSGTSMASPHVAGVVAYLMGLEGPRTPADMWLRLKELALPDVLTDVMGSPNLLLYNGNGA